MFKKILFLLAISLPVWALDPSLIVVPGTLTQEEGTVVDYIVTAPDGSTINCIPASGSLMPLGTTTVTCTAQIPDQNTFILEGTPLQVFPTIGLPTETTATDPIDGAVTAQCVPLTDTEAECTATNSQGNSTTETITILPSTGASIHIQWDAPTTDIDGNPIQPDEIAGYKINTLNTDINNLTVYTTPTNAANYALPLVQGSYHLSVRAENTEGELGEPSDIFKVVI